MELYVVASILGLGYYLTDKKAPNSNHNGLSEGHISKNNIPNGNNIYDSNRVQNIRRGEQIASNEIHKNARSTNSNRVIPGPPKPLFNKVDYDERGLPVEYTERLYSNKAGNEINKNKNKVLSLSGEYVDSSSMIHNNMKPFFGGTVKQNVDEFANQKVIENFTGNDVNYRKKCEIQPLFEPQTNITNPYGSSNLAGYQMERYVVSNKRNNELPVEKLYVGPGLNQGYTAEPSGGYQQANTRDFAMPKNVDELRVKSDPKLTYHGRILSGQKGSVRGKMGAMEKRRPETFKVNKPGDLFGGMAECVKPTARPNIRLQNTNRVNTEGRNSRIGAAGPAGVRREVQRGKVQDSTRQQFEGHGPRNATSSGGWSINEGGVNNMTPDGNVIKKLVPNDYGRSGMNPSDTNRMDTNCQPRTGNMDGLHKKHQSQINPELRSTRKQNVVGNPHWGGNMQMQNTKGVVYDPTDVAKTTMKETTIDNNHSGNLVSQHKKPIVYDPTDILRTTMKETTVENEHTGNVDAVARSDGYKVSNVEAKVTMRDTTSHEYTPNAQGDLQGGYKNKNIKLPTTSRTFTSDVEYVGNASSADSKPMSYADVYNATISSVREQNSVSHTPGMAGANVIKSSENINMVTKREGCLQNKLLDDRGVIPTAVSNAPPVVQMQGSVKDKRSLSNTELNNRLDPSMLDAFNNNPYTQSLHSHAL